MIEGVYDGDTSYGDLKNRGDFGLGTFNGLDGEMVGFDGKFYQIKADGAVYSVHDSMKTPFAIVTFFEPDKAVTVNESLDCNGLERYLDDMLPTKNVFYAIKIEGTFKYVKARSVPRQNRPYPKLVEALKNQPIFEFNRVKGVAAGFRLPAYMDKINVPNYHLHFITEDKKAGGHLLECQIESVKVQIDYSSEFYMSLPKGGDFYKIDLTEEETETERLVQ